MYGDLFPQAIEAKGHKMDTTDQGVHFPGNILYTSKSIQMIISQLFTFFGKQMLPTMKEVLIISSKRFIDQISKMLHNLSFGASPGDPKFYSPFLRWLCPIYNVGF